MNDRDLARRAFAAVLKSAGYATDTLGDGTPAVERHFANPIPAVIVMNWMMPAMSGNEALLAAP